jgi:uncharacterized membrane protein
MPVERKSSANSVTNIPSVPVPALKSTALPSSSVGKWQKPVFIVFLILFLINEALLILRIHPEGSGRWIEAMFLVVATMSALLSLAQRLPLQNVLMAGVLIFSITGAIVSVGSITDVPFGPFIYSAAMGETLFGVLPWTIPMIWVVFIINGRGVARLIMRPWRKTNYYGYWVIGLTCLLVVLMDMALEPFAVMEKHFWLWQSTRTSWLWYSAPWVNFLGWFITCLVAVCLTLPWLINKQPVKRPMDYHPLLGWIFLQVWFFTGNALNHLWLACAITGIGVVTTAVMAIRGARW